MKLTLTIKQTAELCGISPGRLRRKMTRGGAADPPGRSAARSEEAEASTPNRRRRAPTRSADPVTRELQDRLDRAADRARLKRVGKRQSNL